MLKKIALQKKFMFAVLLIALLATACRKNRMDPAPPPGNSKQTPTTNRVDLTNDSLFLYAKEIYYWNTSLPTYDVFNPRQYNTLGSNLDNYDNNLFNIVKSSGSYDYVAGSPYPKYSYIDDITQHNPIAYVPNAKASVDLEGNGNDIGIRPVSYLTSSTTRSYILFVTAVYPGSPAFNAGVKRGWAITKINGQSIGANYDNERAMVNSALSGSSVALEGNKYENGGPQPSGTFSITLNKASYKSSPVYISKVLTAGSKKIGYLAFARFSNILNAGPDLDAAFSDFASQGVTDLVIDLRYNGGGYVGTAEHLINLIAPSSATGVMYVEHFNDALKNRKQSDPSILSHQPLLDDNDKVQFKNGKMVTYADIDYSAAGNTHNFSKAGNLGNVTNVVFIVTGNTASASELTINSLKPKMNVKLVGTTTYGKPIGFFPFRLENRYDVYMSLFETKNSAGAGGYFTGMIPDYAENSSEPRFFDDPRYELGDKNEGYLAKAISVLNPAAAPVTGYVKSSVMSIGGRDVSFNSENPIKPIKGQDEFTGMIENRHRIKN